jgi:hypothetical protein
VKSFIPPLVFYFFGVILSKQNIIRSWEEFKKKNCFSEKIFLSGNFLVSTLRRLRGKKSFKLPPSGGRGFFKLPPSGGRGFFKLPPSGGRSWFGNNTVTTKMNLKTATAIQIEKIN